MYIFALEMSKRIDVSPSVVKQRADIKAAWGAHLTLGGLSLLGFQPLFLPQSTNKNRSATRVQGLFNAVLSPSAAFLPSAPILARSHDWGDRHRFSLIRTRREKDKSESCAIQI